MAQVCLIRLTYLRAELVIETAPEAVPPALLAAAAEQVAARAAAADAENGRRRAGRGDGTAGRGGAAAPAAAVVPADAGGAVAVGADVGVHPAPHGPGRPEDAVGVGGREPVVGVGGVAEDDVGGEALRGWNGRGEIGRERVADQNTGREFGENGASYGGSCFLQ